MGVTLKQDSLLAYPAKLRGVLAELGRRRSLPLYVAGGPVRDWLLGVVPGDLDLTVPTGAVDCAREAAALLGGTLVLLDAEEDVARVVWQRMSLDFSGFRKQSHSIEEDLRQRDFTINALALPLVSGEDGLARLDSLEIIDPTGGVIDLAARLIRCPDPANLLDDPLRMLRAYRFQAVLGFDLDPLTLSSIAAHADRLAGVASERISSEAGLIMASPRAAMVMAGMVESGLFGVILPELSAGRGLAQPDSHHLDVFGHSLEALRLMEELLAGVERWFPGQAEVFAPYLAAEGRSTQLKWAALFHDLGKPVSQGARQGRITFYNHDRLGAVLFEAIARRLHWRREDRIAVSRLIALHMWPFHLNNARLKAELSSLPDFMPSRVQTKLMPSGDKAELSSLPAQTKLMPSGYKAELSSLPGQTKLMPSGYKIGISRRACLRLVKAVGGDLPGLFLLAMADSLAGQGAGKPAGMEESLAELFALVYGVYREHIQPVLASPPLLSGHDLIEEFGLTPGPIFREILDELEKANVDGTVNNRDQALLWTRAFLEERKGIRVE